MGEPPLSLGAVHETAICPLPGVVVTLVGGAGAVATGINAAEVEEAAPVPVALTALTRKT